MAANVTKDNTAAVVRDIQAAIVEALEESGQAVENRAARNCPVDTGRLRASITHQVEGNKSVKIGTNVKYASYVELGTSKMKERSYLRSGLNQCKSEIERIFKSKFS